MRRKREKKEEECNDHLNPWLIVCMLYVLIFKWMLLMCFKILESEASKDWKGCVRGENGAFQKSLTEKENDALQVKMGIHYCFE